MFLLLGKLTVCTVVGVGRVCSVETISEFLHYGTIHCKLSWKTTVSQNSDAMSCNAVTPFLSS